MDSHLKAFSIVLFFFFFFLYKLWGSAGNVRAFRYQIEHEDYTHTGLNNHHCLLGILTIIGLVLRG